MHRTTCEATTGQTAIQKHVSEGAQKLTHLADNTIKDTYPYNGSFLVRLQYSDSWISDSQPPTPLEYRLHLMVIPIRSLDSPARPLSKPQRDISAYPALPADVPLARAVVSKIALVREWHGNVCQGAGGINKLHSRPSEITCKLATFAQIEYCLKE